MHSGLGNLLFLNCCGPFPGRNKLVILEGVVGFDFLCGDFFLKKKYNETIFASGVQVKRAFLYLPLSIFVL